MEEKKKGRPQRGISIFSYGTIGYNMTLDDAFEDAYDTGATCFEILTGNIENYPNPTNEWIDHFFYLCDKYKMQPAELGHWCETHLHRGPKMSDEDFKASMEKDFKLAHLLGFHSLRSKITCINSFCDPEPGWEHDMELILPYAEKYDIAIQSECHAPTVLTRQHIWDYLEFAETHHTKHFGINVDFGTFADLTCETAYLYPDNMAQKKLGKVYIAGNYSKPEDIIPILPYSRTCHAKFNWITEDFIEPCIPYEKILNIMVEQGWNGNLVSEYEGPGREDPAQLGDQMRRHHIMMKRILGY